MKKTVVNPDWNDRSLSEISGSFWKSCALQAAVKLDVFTLLSEAPKTAEEVASSIKGDLRGVTTLLDAVTAMGLLSKKEKRYALTAPSSRYLSRNSDSYMGWRILHHHYLLPSWSRLDEAVLKGVPPVCESASWKREEQREAFLMAMRSNALAMSKKIVPFVEMKKASTLLDLGGGPGTYAVQFCLRNPGLTAVVFDLPGSRPYAEQTIREFGMQDRISFTGGDFLVDEIPGEFDVMWLSHILHSSGPEDCGRIIGKAADALKPGGLMLVHDFWLDENGAGPLFPALFALNMLVRTDNGRSYRKSDGLRMLEESGLVDVHQLDIEIPNDSGILCGVKPG